MATPDHSQPGNLVVLRSNKKKKDQGPVISQFQLEQFFGRGRELREMEEAIAIALSKGARIEPGIHTAELVPERRSGYGVGAGLRMRLIVT